MEEKGQKQINEFMEEIKSLYKDINQWIKGNKKEVKSTSGSGEAELLEKTISLTITDVLSKVNAGQKGISTTQQGQPSLESLQQFMDNIRNSKETLKQLNEAKQEHEGLKIANFMKEKLEAIIKLYDDIGKGDVSLKLASLFSGVKFDDISAKGFGPEFFSSDDIKRNPVLEGYIKRYNMLIKNMKEYLGKAHSLTSSVSPSSFGN